MQIAARPGAAHWLKLERGGTLFTWAAAARPAGLGWCCPSRGWTDTPRHARRGGAWSLPRSPWGEPKNTLVSRELESDARRSGKIKRADLLPLAFFQEGGENEVKTGRGEMIFDFFPLPSFQSSSSGHLVIRVAKRNRFPLCRFSVLIKIPGMLKDVTTTAT